MVRRRRLHHSYRLDAGVRGGDEAPGHPRAVRMHHARGPLQRAGGRGSRGDGLLPGVDRIGERIAAVLDAMQRGVQVAQVREAVRLAQTHGIQTGMFLMWGYEGEQIQDIEATVEHVQACRPDVFLTTVSYPIKGTPYYNEVGDKLVRIGEWRTSTDRDVRVKGRHSRRFYQFADDLLRSSMERPENPIRVAAARAALEASFAEVEA